MARLAVLLLCLLTLEIFVLPGLTATAEHIGELWASLSR